MTKDDLLSPEDVAKILKVTVGTLANYRTQGNGPRFVRAGKIQYRKEDVRAYIDGKVRSSTSETEAA